MTAYDIQPDPFDIDDTALEALIASDPSQVVEAPADTEDARQDRFNWQVEQELIRERARIQARESIAAEKAAEAANKPALEIADVDTLPVSLAGETASLTQEELEATMVTRPVTLLDALRMARKAKATPTLLEIADGLHVFYRGKSNWLSGESGRGKSTAAKLACYQEALAGRASLFIDREKDIENFAASMVEFGDVTDEQAALIFYWNPTKTTDQLMPTILGFIRKYDIDLVVIDSCSRDLSRFSPTASENSNDDVRRWYTACVEPILRVGATPLVVDHVVKPGTGADGKTIQSETLYSKGGVAKREVVTGIAVMARTGEAFSKDKAGYMRLVSAKDNNGTYTEGATIAELHVTPGPVRSTFELRASTQVIAADGKPAPTGKMEQASRLIETANAAGEKPTKNAIDKQLGGSTMTRARAVALLISEGFVKPEEGPGNRHLLVSVRPYREESDPRRGLGASTTGRGFGGGGANVVRPDIF